METAAVNSRAFDTAPVFTGFAGAGTQPRTESSDVPSSNLSAAQAAQVMSYLQGMQTNVGLLRFPTVDEGLQAQVSSTAAAAPPAASTAAAPSGITSSMMVSPQGIAPPTPQEMNGLAQQYGKVDPAVMQYAQQRGVGITVMHPGDNLEKAGVLRPIDPAELKRKLQTANTLEAPFDAKINENMQQFMTAAAQKGIDPG